MFWTIFLNTFQNWFLNVAMRLLKPSFKRQHRRLPLSMGTRLKLQVFFLVFVGSVLDRSSSRSCIPSSRKPMKKSNAMALIVYVAAGAHMLGKTVFLIVCFKLMVCGTLSPSSFTKMWTTVCCYLSLSACNKVHWAHTVSEFPPAPGVSCYVYHLLPFIFLLEPPFLSFVLYFLLHLAWDSCWDSCFTSN